MHDRKKHRHTMLLHHAQELYNHFRTRSDQHLTLASFLGIVDSFEGIVEDGRFDHDCAVGDGNQFPTIEILKSRLQGLEVSG